MGRLVLRFVLAGCHWRPTGMGALGWGVCPGRLVAEATQPEFGGNGLERSCCGGTSPVSIGPCERPCYSCRCCCSLCRGTPARAARPVSATMGPAISVAARGSSIRKRKRRRQALRRTLPPSNPLGVLSGFPLQKGSCDSSYDCWRFQRPARSFRQTR